MNWSIWAPGAFDYSADKLGLTYGATAELNQKQWALRGGYFLMDAESNSNNFDTQVFQRGEYVRRAGDALFAVLAPGQAAHHRLGQQRLFRQLSRHAEQSGAQSRHRADPHGPHQIRLRRSTSSSRSPTTSACSAAGAGTTARPRSWRSPTSTPPCRSAPRSRAPLGPARRRDRHRRRDQRAVAAIIATSSPPAALAS